MDTMYPTQTGSPELTLASNITDTDTVIPLNEDVNLLPAPPNIVTIYNKSTENWETILYKSIDTVNNELETVTRAFEGTAQAWSAGDSVVRLLANYDTESFKANIEELDAVVTTSDPTASDDSYVVGKLWINTSTNAMFVCVDNTASTAVWIETTSTFSGSHQDLTNVNTDDHHTKYTDEEAQDAVGNIMSGTGSATVTYDDTSNTITIDTSGKTEEEIEDIVNGLLVGGTNVTLTYDDVGNTLTISATDTQLSDYEVQTAINNDIDHGSTADHDYNTLSDHDVTSANWGDYEIQKDGTDGTGIINFKTV